MATCPARCCEAFHIAREHLAWLTDEPENVRDGPFLVDMLIPLDHAEAQAIHRAWPGFAAWEPEPGESYFTCRHWDTETRLCTVYEQRPQMCRDYPSGACKHGCGLVAR